MNLIKKTALIFVSSLLFLNSIFSPIVISAQENREDDTASNGNRTDETDGEEVGTWYNQDFKSWLEKVDDEDNPSEIFGERYTSAQVQWIIYSLFSFILHTTIPSNVVSCVFSNTLDLSACKDAITEFLDQEESDTTEAVLPQNRNLVSLVFSTDRSFSGIRYVKDKAENFGIVPVSYAQSAGFGFDALKPIQDMWKASRDIAFGLFVLVTIVFAFMIMFRIKISPQVVISVQSALPKIFSALILVTFSYAIAGFMVDFMYVIIGVLSLLMSNFIPEILGSNIDSTVVFNLLTLGQPTGIPIQLGIFNLVFLYLSPLIITFLILTLIVGAASAGMLFWIPLILLLVVLVVGLWISIKTIWALLKAFVNIILLTIFAPIQLVLGVAIPSLGFGGWMRSYLANLSVFVVTGVLYWFSVIFLIQSMHIGLLDTGLDLASIVSGNIFGVVNGSVGLAEQVANFKPSWPPLLGSAGNIGVGILFLGVSFVLFTLIPKATEIVQGFISGKPFAYGSAIGETLTQPFTGALRFGTAAQQIGNAYTTRFGTRRGVETQEKATDLDDNRQPPEGTTYMKRGK